MLRRSMALFLVYLCAVFTGCGSDSGKAESGAPSGDSADSMAAQQAATSADQAAAADNAAGAGQQATFLAFGMAPRLMGVGATGEFEIGGCSADVSYTTTASSTAVTIQASDTFSSSACTGDLKLSGSQNITITASLDDTNRTSLVTSALTETLVGGDQVAISTLDPNLGWTYKLVAGGTRASGDVNVLVSINEHRVRSSDGNIIFDHNITTPDATGVLVVAAYGTDGSPKSRTIASGEIDVHHNIAKFSAQHTYDNLVHDVTGTCACPSAGSFTQVVSSDTQNWSYTRSYTFTGCGEATVTTRASTDPNTTNGTATVVWNNCTN